VSKKVRAQRQAAARKGKRTRGANRATLPKMSLMHQFGMPKGRRGAMSSTRRAALRKAAGSAKNTSGGVIKFSDIMDTIRQEKLKSWVCVGPRRTGCGGGAKNLRGGHQVGIFATSHR
jgi:hypothetical protein